MAASEPAAQKFDDMTPYPKAYRACTCFGTTIILDNPYAHGTVALSNLLLGSDLESTYAAYYYLNSPTVLARLAAYISMMSKLGKYSVS